MVYACGPNPMLRAVAEFCAEMQHPVPGRGGGDDGLRAGRVLDCAVPLVSRGRVELVERPSVRGGPGVQRRARVVGTVAWRGGSAPSADDADDAGPCPGRQDMQIATRTTGPAAGRGGGEPVNHGSGTRTRVGARLRRDGPDGPDADGLAPDLPPPDPTIDVDLNGVRVPNAGAGRVRVLQLGPRDGRAGRPLARRRHRDEERDAAPDEGACRRRGWPRPIRAC